MALIAPALMAADLARFGEALEVIESAAAPMVHVDVADGHFTPLITVGQPVVKSLRRKTRLALDVHLLIERPERYVVEFIEAGADRVAIHPESTCQLNRALELIRTRGARAGLALNLATPVSSVADVLGEVDFLTVLCGAAGVDLGQPPPQLGNEERGTTHAGSARPVQSSGAAQDTMASTSSGRPGLERKAAWPSRASLEKIRAAVRARQDRALGFAIVAEGGVSLENCEELLTAGADILVAGSAIFHTDNPKTQLMEFIRLAAKGAVASDHQ